MFKKSKLHQRSLFTNNLVQLDKRRLDKLNRSQEKLFYKLFTSQINEGIFSILFNNTQGRPNSSIKSLVASIVYINHKGWTHEDFFDALDFNLLTRVAISNVEIDKKIFSPATFYNFQNRLLSYWKQTGVNLLELVFNDFTAEQLKNLGIKLDIMRSDSVQIMSNISDYSRTRLLVEVIRRVFRVLDETDKLKFQESFSIYLEKSSSKFVYELDNKDTLDNLAFVYQRIFLDYYDKYKEFDIFGIFKRVFNEHFIIETDKITTVEITKLPQNTITEDLILTSKFFLKNEQNISKQQEIVAATLLKSAKAIPTIKNSKDLESGFLQSPDDSDATYREKNGKSFKGQTVTITESCNPKNDINLILDVAIKNNNIDDSKNFSNILFRVKNRYSNINEWHVDGAFSSDKNDEIASFLGISVIATGIRGRKATIPIIINLTDTGNYTVACPNQEVIASKGSIRFKAVFDYDNCKDCPLANKCKLSNTKKGKTFYFSKKQAKANIRNNKIKTLPKEKQKLRPNVESTMKSFHGNRNNKDKIKVRGKFKTMLYAFSLAISVNFRRIFKYQNDKNRNSPFKIEEMASKEIPFYKYLLFLSIFLTFLEILFFLTKNLSKNRI